MIAKLLDNQNAILILQLLSKKPLSIPQIVESLSNIGSQTIIAILGELHRFKLVQRINKGDSKSFSEDSLEMSFDEKIKIDVGTLGIPLSEYVSVWEEISRNPTEVNLRELTDFYFTLPGYIKEKIDDCEVNEIRNKILGINP